MKILLIDDQMTILTSMKEALEPGGYECILFDQPVKAMNCLSTTHFDVVVTDLKMPKMDGIEVLKRVQNVRPGTPVIIMTGYADTENAIHAVNYGAYAFYQKPIKIKKFIKTLKELESAAEKSESSEIMTNQLENDRSALIAEMNHRVINNLQIISSLLRLQSSNMQNDEAMQALTMANNRIRSMAIVHEHLYSYEKPSGIKMHEYIPLLAANLKKTLNNRSGIQFNYDLQAVSLHLDKAIPLGMIMNEVLANSLLHAFTGKKSKSCHIKIELGRRIDNNIRICIIDNGIGLPADFDSKSIASMGMTTINVLIEQLNAEVHWYTQSGTGFELIIPDK
ncbi:response regulator [bacterium]|nr:response regulator [bacterium]